MFYYENIYNNRLMEYKKTMQINKTVKLKKCLQGQTVTDLFYVKYRKKSLMYY